MFSAYIPNLMKPSKNSSSDYKDFHNIFYLSQLTNLTLISYMDSFIEYFSKEQILIVKKDELLKKGIISIHNLDGQGGYTINNEDEFRAYDLEDFIPQIIDEKIKARFSEMDSLYMCMGLKLDEKMNKEIEINLQDLLKTTNKNNWYSLIRGFLNVWEFLFLFSTFEMTLRKIIKDNGMLETSDLISEFFNSFVEIKNTVENNGFISCNGNIKLWIFYTELRNIYSHYHGILLQDKKNKLCGKLDNFKNSLGEIDLINKSLMDLDNLFSKNTLVVGKFYLLKDEELNMFRNFVINIMESYDKVYQKQKNRSQG